MNGKRFAFTAFLLFASLAFADEKTTANAVTSESYVRPPKEIEEAALAPWYLNGSVSNFDPERTRYVVSVSAGLPRLADLARPYANLGGLQVDTRANRARRLSFGRTTAFEIKPLGPGAVVKIAAPKGATIGNPTWSPDGKRLAYYAHYDRATFLFVADAKTGKAKQMTTWPVLATLDSTFDWLGDSKRIVAVFVPAKRGGMPIAPIVAATPLVQVSDDKPNSLRTYAGLMSTPTDEALLEWCATGQLGVADVDSGRVKEVGQPTMFKSVDPSADGQYFRVSKLEKPFSYIVPMSNFPDRDVLWDAEGKQVVEFSKRGLRLGRTGDTSPPKDDDKRDIDWRPDGAGLSFLQVAPLPPRREEPKKDGEATDLEAQRGGQRGTLQGPAQPNRRDRVMLWVPPYGEKDIKLVYESENRIGGVQYSEDGKTLFLTQTIAGKTQLNVVRLDNPSKVFTATEIRAEGQTNARDQIATRPGQSRKSVVQLSSDGKYIYLLGETRYSDPQKSAPRPYLERVEIETGKKERVFESSDVRYEQVRLLDDDLQRLLINRQSPTSIDQTFLLDNATKAEQQLTANRDYTPDLSQAPVKTYMVKRNDGFTFEVKVTLPIGTKPGAKLPAFFWFYPAEFPDQAAYDRTLRTFNKNLFRRSSASNKVILLRAGYALVDPDCPIVGPTDRKNDGYVPQLRNNLAATIDAICEDGTIDRNRLAIGGHSYGAFSTLNAMVHTPYFKAGIAGDGNYNRLLTPFGFQSETRQLWDSREVYLSMSPMLYLEQLTGAILLYHGMDDQNMGTDPVNSPRLFQALEALGKNAALYMYPYEDHGQIAEESVLDQWARFVAWLDKWVKNPR